MATGNTQARGLSALGHLTQWVVRRSGPVGEVSAQALAFCRSTPLVPDPDLQLTLFPWAASVDANGQAALPARRLVSIGANINYPASRGFLRLRSADAADPIMIFPRLLEFDEDVTGLLGGLDWIRRIVAMPPLAKHVLQTPNMPPSRAGRVSDIAFIRSVARPFMHPVGTCRMGADATAVVGPDLRVRGADQLWVADASIFPSHIAGNINATVLMVGEKAADLIAA